MGALAVALAAPRVGAQILPQSRRDRQTTAARKLLPAQIQLRPPRVEAEATQSGGEPRVVRLRVYAARDFRAQTMGWQSRVRRLCDRVGQLTQRWPGVRFEVAELKGWDRDSANVPLDKLVDDLQALDAGADVDWVVGLASAVPVMPESIHNLGAAHVLGRHFVIRSLHDLAEYQLVRSQLDLLDDAQREYLVGERKAHKEVVVFLHEWAHTLGAIHATHPSLIMNPSYSAEQFQFDDANARVVELSLRERSQGRWLSDLRALIEGTRFAEWDEGDRKTLLRLLRGEAAGGGARAGTGARSGRAESGSAASEPPLPPEDAKAFNQAVDHFNAHDDEKAWAALSPLLSRQANHPRVAELACSLAHRRSRGPDRLAQVEPACTHAVEVAPADPWSPLLLADAYLGAGRVERALAAIAQGRERLEHAGDALVEQWRLLASLYQRTASPTLAEEAAHHAGGATADQVAAWALNTRRRFAIPPQAAALGLSREHERDYIRTIEAARLAISEGKTATATQLIKQLQQEFGKLPAVPLLQCELYVHQGRSAAAEAACTSALKLQEDATIAHLMAGLCAARTGRPKPAALHLRRALELDPTDKGAWTLLAQVYRRSGQRAALSTLEADYRKQFGAALP